MQELEDGRQESTVKCSSGHGATIEHINSQQLCLVVDDQARQKTSLGEEGNAWGPTAS